PRCGCPPEAAGALAELAQDSGLTVRGVMGYEGHAVGVPDRAVRTDLAAAAMELLLRAHRDVGGELITAGGTGTYHLVPEPIAVRAGSCALMDGAYAGLGLPFRQALGVLATVISVSASGHAVANAGLKALGMDHGPPSIEGGHEVMFVSDEHVTFTPAHPVAV